MNLNDQIHRAAQRSTDSELYAALETLKAHVRYREELKEHAAQGGRLSRPAWAWPGKKRGGHVTAGCGDIDPCTPCICERLSTPYDDGYARIVLRGSTTLKTAVS